MALLYGGVAERLLHLLEGAHRVRAHTLAADAVFLREVLQRGRVVLQTALLQNMTLALVEVGHRGLQQRAALAQLFSSEERRVGKELVIPCRSRGSSSH